MITPSSVDFIVATLVCCFACWVTRTPPDPPSPPPHPARLFGGRLPARATHRRR